VTMEAISNGGAYDQEGTKLHYVGANKRSIETFILRLGLQSRQGRQKWDPAGSARLRQLSYTLLAD